MTTPGNDIVDPARGAFGWLERLSGFAPLAATLFGVLYALGFVIVNAYLGSYGIRELDALRTRYVGAGLVFIVYVGVALAIAREIFLLRQRRGDSVVFFAAFVVAPIFAAIVEVTVIWRASSGAFGDVDIPLSTLWKLFAVFALSNAGLIFGSNMVELARHHRSRRRTRAPVGTADVILSSRPAQGLTTWVLVIIVIGVSLLWAELVYPEIPSYLGGGRPEPVRLVTTQSVADACPPCVSRDVLLLDADDKRIVVLATGADGRQFAVEVFLVSGNDRAVIHKPR